MAVPLAFSASELRLLRVLLKRQVRFMVRFGGANFMREVCVIRGKITGEHVRLRKL